MRNKKAFTLVEMCIVLALVAIVGTMVTSFCIMVSGDTGRTQSVTDLQSDIQKTKNKLAKWVSEFDMAEYKFYVTADGHTLAATDGTKNYSFRIEGNSLQGDMLSEDDNIYLKLRETAGVSFEIESNGATSLIIATFESETALNDEYVVAFRTRIAGATSAPTETHTPDESPVPTETLAPTESPVPTESPIPTESLVPTESPIPTETIVPAETTAPVETVAPAETVVPAETAVPAETVAPVETIIPTETITPSESPMPTNGGAD